jgi:hypothetical protein
MLLMSANMMENFDIHPMPSSGKISMTHTRNLPMNQGHKVCAKYQWNIHLPRGAASTTHGW